MIKRTCAFCLAFMGWKSADGARRWEQAWGETHGICKICLRRELDEDAWDDWQEYGGEG